jgi:peptidoglycan/LPS O-acetylase OafA/YrhL
MYLYHLPLLLLFNTYAPAALGGFAFPCYFGIIVATATASFHFIERPFMRSPRRAMTRPRDPAPPAK